jgi:hypothetical protein
MLVIVTRTGGFAGMSRRWAAQAPDELVLACSWEEEASPPAGEPDRFVYRIEADDRSRAVPESRLAGPWRELVDYVLDQARRSGPDEAAT